MADEKSDGIAVLQGEAGRDLRWVVSVDEGRGSLLVMLTLFRGGHRAPGIGFDGTMSLGGAVLESSRGRADGYPWHVMARTDASATRVVATTDRGTEVELALSAFMPEYGSTFAAAVMPDGECPCALRVERDGAILDVGPQPSWPCPPAIGG